MALQERLKKNSTRTRESAPAVLGMRKEILNVAREEVAKLKGEIMQELRRILEEKIGEEGITTIKGARGAMPKVGVDFLTPKEVRALKKELKGIPGVRGKPGFGEPGRKGDRGDDGSPDDAMGIANKLNTLTETLEQGIIKGLNNKFRSMNRSIAELKGKIKAKGGGGGGMSNTQHETFSGDGSTTSFTLGFNVAVAGNAIIVRYQGQTLDLGSHYTISGRTLATTFTPANNTTLSVTYWRT